VVPGSGKINNIRKIYSPGDGQVTALDEENSVNIFNYLKKYASDGSAVLLVSHDSMAM
jgi:ABC-type lipoprotein export system ATPase subunit